MHQQLHLTEADTLSICNKENSTIVLIFSAETTNFASIKVTSNSVSKTFTNFPSKTFAFTTIDENLDVVFTKQVSLTVDIWIVPYTSCLYNSYIVTNKKDINLIVNSKQGKLNVCLFTPFSTTIAPNNKEQKEDKIPVIEYGFIHGDGEIKVYDGNSSNSTNICTEKDCSSKTIADYFIHFSSEQAKGFYYSREQTVEKTFDYCLVNRPIPLKSDNEKYGKSFPLVGEDITFKCYRSFASLDSFYDSSIFSIIAQITFFIIFPIIGALSIILVVCCPKKKAAPKQALDTSLYPDDNQDDDFGLVDEDDVTITNDE